MRWPNLSIQDVNEGNRLFTWEIPKMKFAALEGYLDATRRVLILDGDIRDCAEFAVWYRQLISETCELVFYDEGYTGSVTLGPDTSVNEITAPFLGFGREGSAANDDDEPTG